jgi:sugar phosphate isomerase/epimerase
LTQLEWIDLCANDLTLDGVDLSVEHFPRTDEDYLAQIKKLCTDRCLTVAAVNAGVALGAGDVDAQAQVLEHCIGIARGVGAPLLRVRCGSASASPGLAWRELIRALKAICAHAKLHNITLAVQPGQDTLIDSPAYVRRAFKETDSAWIRLAAYAADLASPAAADWSALLPSAVIAIARFAQLDTGGADQQVDYRHALAALAQAKYRGFVSLEYAGAEPEEAAVPRALSWLRSALLKPAA